MPEPSETHQGGEPVETFDCNTMRTSQSEQVRGYLESLTDMEFIDELQSALEHAQRLTTRDWKIVITSEQITIQGDREVQGNKRAAEGQKRIKIPRPKSLEN
ncbi:MAG: hypothetical protein ACLFVJ_15885 [Persicimonas sp.]